MMLAALLMSMTSLHAHAASESRKIYWSWGLYGADSGDFESPEAVITALNNRQEEIYDQQASMNCGSAYKIIYTLPNRASGPGGYYNGQLTFRLTDGGVATSYSATCYVNGVKVRDAIGPTSGPANGGVAAAANLRCPAQWFPTTSAKEGLHK